MDVPRLTLMLWLLFGGTHLLGSSGPVRRRLISALGLWGFKLTYSLVALATLVPLIWTYWNNRHEGAMLFEPDRWSVRVTEVLMLPAVMLFVLAFASPNPATTAAEMRGRFASSARGIHRVTRHPMNTAFGMFGAAHMVSNPTTGDWAFWGGFLAFAWASALHQDQRSARDRRDEVRLFRLETSLVPFVAIFQGRQRLALREIRWAWVAGGLVLFALLRTIHPAWIGGFS